MAVHEEDDDKMGQLAPVGSEEEYAVLVREMVDDFAPRAFALVEERGERADGWIVAWGLAFEDHAQVVDDKGRPWGACASAESAQALFARMRRAGNVRLVWCGAEAVSDTHARGHSAA